MAQATASSSRVRLLRRRQVLQRLGVNTSTLFRWVRDKVFPEPMLLRPNYPVWPEDEVDAWIAARPRGLPKRSRATPLPAD
jgi:predicted DNA-binding transcriptional regulator AlpA